MKRFHVHVAVRDLDGSKAFYTKLFGAEPAVGKRDYAQWMIEDPRINFAISAGCDRAGIEHLGLQADTAEELAEIRERLVKAGAGIADEPGANCCYAYSDKHWTVDPQGIAWESFHTVGVALHYGDDHGPRRQAECACGDNGCCAG
ncbi:MAG: VOC family protein [Gammaproteobacteria bacterium]|nr:VOC family protein [Gammaproteobacteria bacterium]